MNLTTFTSLLEHPDRVTPEQTTQLKQIIKEFPFFQAARALQLKGLKNEDSFLYNNQLKQTAAHTQDRTVLFDFITSEIFNQSDISQQIKSQEAYLHNMPVYDAVDVSADMEAEELVKAHQVLSKDFFIPKEPSEEPETIPEEQLQIGKPLDFNPAETHSFGEWLKLTSFNKIDRTDRAKESAEEEASHRPKIEYKPLPEPTLYEADDDPERTRRLELIDKFIETNPKIKVNSPDSSFKKTNLEDRFQPSDSLMTETLARVYVEQKNFSKAKQAYRILSLKYPEKSGFFADQIRAIEKLQENK
ncbi:hypothetical protein DSM03_105170 [Leeuwenhoekiella aestuarii]|uniref:hypothetical protein n=1 Tax=Leeuwenhoekiella aestuarii TaxID=2249426 RepID=UPI000FFE8710|nr:hypothetical protein [Leeuwenhoekiella aestuarii]RXG14634.1 hypothetical protein DSM03_105170 [Leeuwenhoekiella aestuarii]